MPLFGGDLVTVTTPDGRQIQMPSGLADSFSALPVVPPPSPDGPVTSPVPSAPPPGALPPAAPTDGPITSPDQVPAGNAASIPRGPVTQPGPEEGTQSVAPPRAPTNAELAKNGPGQTLVDQQGAIDEQKKAINDSAQIQADEATKEGARMAARDAQTQQILEERAKQAAANEAELNARITKRDQLADKIANTRIDRNVDNPIWASIGLILSAVGTAMKQRPGEKWDDPAYNALMQQIDRKVDTQMKNVEIQRGALAQMNVGVAEQRQHNVDRITEIDARRDGAIQQAQQAVQTMAMQAKSPLVKAQAQELIGKLDQERATMRGQASERAQAQINHERQMAQAAQFHKEQMDLERTKMAIEERDKLAATAEKIIDRQNAARDKQSKDAAERSIWDPRTADAQLNPTGQAKLKQADQIEAAARQQQDPQQVAKMQKYAADLRDSARSNDGVLAPDKATADKVRPIIGGTQQMTDQIDRVTQVLKAGPSGFDREAWAGLKTELGDLAKNYAKMAGERVTPKAIDNAMENIISFDPDSMFSREASKNKAISALKSLQGIVNDTATATLRENGIKSNWKPTPRSEQGTSLNIDQKTANEVENDRSLGYLNPSRYTGGQEQAQKEAGDAASSSYGQDGGEAGLSPNATTHIKALAARAATAGDKDHAQIIEALKGPIESGLREGGRASVAWGAIDVLSSANPDVLKEVVASLPDMDRKRVESELAFRAKASPTTLPASMLTPSTYDPDRNAARYEASPEGRAAYEQEGRDMEGRRLDAKAVLERQQRRYEEQRARALGGGR